MRLSSVQIFQQGLSAMLEQDGFAALVESNDKYGYSDPWHYDSSGYIDLGREFAAAMSALHR